MVRFSLRASALVVALTLHAAGALRAQDPPPPATLSLEEAVALARTHNPEYLAQENDRRAARAAVRAARADFLPSASASSSFGYTARGERRFGSVAFGEQPDYYSSSYSLGLSYQLSGAKLAQPSITRARERATEERIAGARAGLEAQVAQQYLTVLQAQEEEAQAAREVERAAEHERLARARLEVGAGTPLDVRRAEVRKGEAEVRLLQAANALAVATLRLGELLGTPVEPGVRLTTEFRVFSPRWEAEALVARALGSNPNLLSARAGATAARTGIAAARSSYLPTLSLGLGVDGSVFRAGDVEPLVKERVAGAEQRHAGCLQGNRIAQLVGGPTQDCSRFVVDPAAIRRGVEEQNGGWPFDYTRQPLSASLTLSLPVFTGLSRQQRVEEARVAAEDARHQVRAQENRLRVEVATALRNLETAHRTVQLQEQVRATAGEELRLARERFRHGAAGSVEVTDAQTSLARAEQAKIAAVYDFHKTLAALEALVGGPLEP